MKHTANNGLIRFIGKCTVFMAITVILLLGFNYITSPVYTYRNSNWPTTATFRQFYKMDKNTVDVLFFGSSFAVNAFNPQEIYDETGIRTYSLASEQQSPFISYYWLREALKTQQPQAVVLETRYLFHRESNTPVNMNESFLRKSIEPMKFSPLKADLINTLCDMDTNQNRLSYYFTNLEYHTRWKELNMSELFSDDADHAELKGYGPLFVTNTEAFEPVILQNLDFTIQMDPLMKEYLLKIEDLCKENNIRLILVTVPASDMHEGMHHEITNYAEEHSLDYYDFSEEKLFSECGWDLTVETPVDHMNVPASIKMSGLFGNILKDSYQISPVSDVQWEQTSSYGQMIRGKAYPSTIQELDTYLSLMDQNEYTLFVSLDKMNDIPSRFQAAVEKLEISYTEGPFMAVISSETIQIFTEDLNSIRAGLIKKNGLKWEMMQNEEGTGIILNGSSFSRKQNGLHITVYDPELNKVIDEVCFVLDDETVRAVRDLGFMN